MSSRGIVPGVWWFGDGRRSPLVAPLAVSQARCLYGGGAAGRVLWWWRAGADVGFAYGRDQAEAPEVVPASLSWDMFRRSTISGRVTARASLVTTSDRRSHA